MDSRAGSWLVLLLAAVGCRASDVPAESPREAVWTSSPAVCPLDHVREYHCEELLPRSHALPAAPPFEACPSSVDGHQGLFSPVPPIALFDSDYTAHTRRRMPPGHSCCYSWCAPVVVKSRQDVPAGARCDAEHSMPEEFCVDTLEAGTSRPAPRPFDRCPEALVPPSAAVYSVPRAAPFDAQLTATRRQAGFDACCYAWCSKAPPSASKR